MATWTKATLARRVLEELGVVGESQTPSAEQQARVEEIIDSVYDRLRPKHLVPFLTSAIPLWAQVPLRDVVAASAAPRFGYTGGRLQERHQLAKIGMGDLADGAAGAVPPVPLKSDFH